MRRLIGGLSALVGICGLAGAAQAGGYPAYYGYSPYLGGPTTYFTRENDVQQATTVRDTPAGFGTRTYYRGGPFWTYAPARARRVTYASHRHRRVVLRRRG